MRSPAATVSPGGSTAMADITMPQLGETVTEGTITKWFKQVGDQVAEDEAAVRGLDRQGRLRGPVAGARLRHRDPRSRGRDGRRRRGARGHRPTRPPATASAPAAAAARRPPSTAGGGSPRRPHAEAEPEPEAAARAARRGAKAAEPAADRPAPAPASDDGGGRRRRARCCRPSCGASSPSTGSTRADQGHAARAGASPAATCKP